MASLNPEEGVWPNPNALQLYWGEHWALVALRPLWTREHDHSNWVQILLFMNQPKMVGITTSLSLDSPRKAGQQLQGPQAMALRVT